MTIPYTGALIHLSTRHEPVHVPAEKGEQVAAALEHGGLRAIVVDRDGSIGARVIALSAVMMVEFLVNADAELRAQGLRYDEVTDQLVPIE